MKTTVNWARIIFISGVIALIAGAIDPLEGSIAICLGSILMVVGSSLLNDRHRTLFLICAFLIGVGVAYLWFISSLGGFGGSTGRSILWGLPILTYPVGWLLLIILLIKRVIKPGKPIDRYAH